MQDVLNSVTILLLPAAAVALVVRYVRAGPADRQRLKPLALVAVALAGSLLLQALPPAVGAGQVLVVATVAVGLPVALAVGALRYRVWDLDRVIIAAIVYGGLALIVGGGYVTAVVLVAWLVGGTAPTSSLLPSIIAAALVALAFAPVRDRITRAARRLVYGVRATLYDALSALPRQLADAPAAADVLPHTAETLSRGLGVPAARVRAFLDGGQESVAWFPAPPPDPEGIAEASTTPAADGPLVVVPVRHLGQVAGDVAVQPWADRPLGSRDRRLLADLAVFLLFGIGYELVGPPVDFVAAVITLGAVTGFLLRREAQAAGTAHPRWMEVKGGAAGLAALVGMLPVFLVADSVDDAVGGGTAGFLVILSLIGLVSGAALGTLLRPPTAATPAGQPAAALAR